MLQTIATIVATAVGIITLMGGALKFALNGTRKDIKAIRGDIVYLKMKLDKSDDMHSQHGERLSRLEGKLDKK